MEYSIKNITDLTEIESGQIQPTDYFLLGRHRNSYYSTFKTMFSELSALVLENVQYALQQKYDDISCLNGKTDQELHARTIDAYMAKQILDEINSKTYPVGSIFITTSKYNPQEVLNWPNSEWRKISGGRCLMGSFNDDGSDISTVVDSGLPSFQISANIKGLKTTDGGGHTHTLTSLNTACYSYASGKQCHTSVNDNKQITVTGGEHTHDIDGTNAILSGNGGVYGKSTIVQPPAFIVNIWERIK